MAIITTAPTPPPTITAVCELLLRESDAGEEVGDGDDATETSECEDVGLGVGVGAVVGVVVGKVGKTVGGGGRGAIVVGVGAVGPITAPGPTSGLSEKGRCEESGHKKTERGFPTTNGHR